MRVPGLSFSIDGFLLAMFVVVLLALAWPELGAADGLLPVDAMAHVGIALVFFLHGANLSRAALRSGALNWRVHLLIHATTFIVFPSIGFAVFILAAPVLPLEARLGVFFLCAVSSTISTSIAMVSLARGNVGAAVFNATLSGLIGLVATPALMGLVGTGSAVDLPLGEAVLDICLALLVPFLLGQFAPAAAKAWIHKHKPIVGKLDRAVILLIVYGSFCTATHDGLWRRYDAPRLLLLCALTAALLLLVLMLTSFASRRMGLSKEDEIAVIFCGSKKSLANGAPIAQILFGTSPMLGAILLPLLLYHQLQLLVCTALARRFARRELPSHSEA